VAVGQSIKVEAGQKGLGDARKITGAEMAALNSRVGEEIIYSAIKGEGEGAGILVAALLDQDLDGIKTIIQPSEERAVGVARSKLQQSLNQMAKIRKRKKAAKEGEKQTPQKQAPTAKALTQLKSSGPGTNEMITAALSLDRKNVIAGKTGVVFDAGRSVEVGGGSEDLQFRFDFDGDGEWDFPAKGEFSPETRVKHTYKEPGHYIAVVEVLSPVNGKEKTFRKVEVTPNFPINVLAKPVQDANLIQTSVFGAIATDKNGPVNHFEWDFNGDGKYDKTTKKAVARHKYGKPGRYKVIVKGVSPEGDMAFDTTTAVVFNADPVVNAGNKMRGKVNSPVQFGGSARDPDGKIVEYSWDFNGDGKTDWRSSSSPKTRHRYAKPGNYKAVLTAKSADGQTASAKVTVTVK